MMDTAADIPTTKPCASKSQEVSAEDFDAFIEDRKRAYALLRVAQVASSSLIIEDVLQSISDEIVNATGANCNAFLFPRRAKFGNYYFVNPLPSEDYRVPDPPDGLSLEALETKRPAIALDAMTDPRTDKRTMRHFGVKSAVAFPLLFQGEALAAGFLSSPVPRMFTDAEIEWVMAIASAGAMAVANAEYHETRIQLALAQEHRRLAHDMHDGFAQIFATMKMNFNVILLSQQLDETSTRLIVESKQLADQAYREVKEAVYGLRFLGTLDIIETDSFYDYVQSFAERNNLVVDLTMDEAALRLLNNKALIQTNCIINEALTNIRKHADARHVRISTEDNGQHVIISVEDDGRGINGSLSPDEKNYGVGISTMKERAHEVGGELSFERSALGGTLVRFCAPYR